MTSLQPRARHINAEMNKAPLAGCRKDVSIATRGKPFALKQCGKDIDAEPAGEVVVARARVSQGIHVSCRAK
jgi:hypothetical protein